MINDIVEMILKEARDRPNKDPAGRIASVLVEVKTSLSDIVDNLIDEERRKREDEGNDKGKGSKT